MSIMSTSPTSATFPSTLAKACCHPSTISTNAWGCRDSLLLWAVRRDKGFEVEVTDPKTEERESEASEGEGKRELELGVQCGRWG